MSMRLPRGSDSTRWLFILLVCLVALALGLVAGLGYGIASVAIIAVAILTGLFPYSLPAVLLVGPGIIHLVAYSLAGASNRADVLSKPLQFAPLIAALVGTPVLVSHLRNNRFFPPPSEGRSETRVHLLFGMVGLLAILVLRFGGTPAPIYAQTKTLGFITFSLAPAILFMFIIQTPTDLRRALGAIAVIGSAWLGTLLILAFLAGDFNLYLRGAGELLGGVSEAGGGVGSRAALVGLASLGLLAQDARPKILLTISSVLSMTLLALSGHRGSFVAFAGGLLLIGFTRLKMGGRVSRGLFVFGGIVVLLAGTAAAISVTPKAVQERYASPLTSESFLGRVSAQKTALAAWKEHPFRGNGTGSSATIITGRDQSSFGEVGGLHPHNVTIELLTEVGLLGTAFFLGTVFYLLIQGFRAATTRFSGHSATLVGLFVSSFIESQGGADLTVQNDLWLIGALLAIAISQSVSDPSSKVHTVDPPVAEPQANSRSLRPAEVGEESENRNRF